MTFRGYFVKLEIDINCDLGEAVGKVGHDAEIMPFITSANVASGFHAGNPVVMAQTVKLAKENEVAVGVHPSYQDPEGFGRREMRLSKKDVRCSVIYQIGALQAFTTAAGVNLQHVKPHGALYNAASKKEAFAEAIIEAVDAVNPRLVVYALADSMMAKMTAEAGLRVAHEAFVDRGYNPDGSLVPRNMEGAVISEPETVADRALSMVKERKVDAIYGGTVKFSKLHTICFHGDTLNAVQTAKRLNRALLDANVEVKAVGTFI